DRESFTMPLYFGPGLRFVDYDQGRNGPSYSALGLRIVGGMLFDFKTVPLDVFIEIAGIPEYGFGDNHGFAIKLNADAGIRYYFEVDELEGRTTEGVTVRMDRVRATGGRKGVVVCLHAMMTDGRYFGARRENSFTTALAAAGLDVIVADFRGHGRSVPPHA